MKIVFSKEGFVRWALRAAFSENGFTTSGAGKPILETPSQVTERLQGNDMQTLHEVMCVGIGANRFPLLAGKTNKNSRQRPWIGRDKLSKA
ncbi:hypothetical protein [Rhodoferax sp. WC2427]|uniref:hypothetical protein n=1 Tax=Rhodoferax sp. WC2427 TaxID=3234144 RepID=UPI0034654555